jgi:hypothetical protein
VSRWNLYLLSWQLTFFGKPLFLSYWDFLSGPSSVRAQVCQGPGLSGSRSVRAQVWRNLCRRSMCCCRPSLVGDRSTRSSANSKHLTLDSSRVRPGAADCSSALSNLLIYILNRVGLNLHPCLTPRPCAKERVFKKTTHLLFVYMDFIMLYFFPQHHFPSISIADPPIKFVWNQQSMIRLCLCFGFFFFLISVCRVNIYGLSYGNLVKSQFDICSVPCFHWGNVRVCC